VECLGELIELGYQHKRWVLLVNGIGDRHRDAVTQKKPNFSIGRVPFIVVQDNLLKSMGQLDCVHIFGYHGKHPRSVGRLSAVAV
jgi:hypothetical protein